LTGSASFTVASVMRSSLSTSTGPGSGTMKTSSKRRNNAGSSDDSTLVVATNRPGASYSSINCSSELTIREASPMSFELMRDRAMKSHSSSSSTQGRSFAAIKIARRLVADSPKYDEISTSKRTFISGRPVFHARRFAPNDLPQPGGP
jgi:hypothetical protein